MARKIKFPLEMENGVKVRSVEELKANFSLEKVIEHYKSGKLIHWLSAQNLSEMKTGIEKLHSDSPDFYKELCDILGMENEEYIKNVKEREDALANIHICHCFSKEETKKEGVSGNHPYGIFLKDMQTGTVTKAVSFKESELLKDKIGEPVWYERHGQWILYVKANQEKRTTPQTMSLHLYDMLSRKDKILCGELPQSEAASNSINICIYQVNLKYVLWQCCDNLYLSEYDKLTRIYPESEQPESEKATEYSHPDFYGICHRINAAMTNRGILFTVCNAANAFEKTLYYYSLSNHHTVSLGTRCFMGAPVETDGKLYIPIQGSLFFVDEDKPDFHEICPLRNDKKDFDKLEAIRENEEYIVWVVGKRPGTDGKAIKFLECYEKQSGTRTELAQFESILAKKAFSSHMSISLTDKILLRESASNYAGEMFLESERNIGYDGSDATDWVTTMEQWDWTNIDAGSKNRSITTLYRFDELPICHTSYLQKRQEMLNGIDKMKEQLEKNGLISRDIQFMEENISC